MSLENPDFKNELAGLLNKFSVDNAVGMADWILAKFIVDMLEAYKQAKEQNNYLFGTLTTIIEVEPNKLTR